METKVEKSQFHKYIILKGIKKSLIYIARQKHLSSPSFFLVKFQLYQSIHAKINRLFYNSIEKYLFF